MPIDVINDPYAGNIFGRIGRGIGKSLAEQVPKEMERIRLSQGLKDLESRGYGETPLQQASNLVGIPGMNPQMLQYFLPLLQAQQARQEQLGGGGGGAVRDASTGNLPPVRSNRAIEAPAIREGIKAEEAQGQVAGAPTEEEKMVGLVTPDTIQAQLNPIVRKTPEEKWAEAQDLSRRMPGSYPLPQNALDFIERQENQAIAAQESLAAKGRDQMVAEAAVNGEFDDILGKFLQKEGNQTYGDVIGEYQQALREKAYDDVRRGMTPKAAGRKWADEGLHIAKSLQKLKTEADKMWTLQSPKPADLRSTIKSTAQEFRKRGLSQAFKNYLVAHNGLDAPHAALFSNPLNANKDMSAYIAKTPKAVGAFTRGKEKALSDQDYNKVAQGVVKRIKDTDSLQTIGLYLEDKGYDPNKFRAAVSELPEEEKRKLSNEQIQELQESFPRFASLGTHYLFTFAGIPMPGENE